MIPSDCNGNKSVQSPWFDRVGLTPYRALWLHLVLIGYPLRYGLQPTGWGGEQFPILHSILIPPPCHMFHVDRKCTMVEENVIHDFGARYISQYSLVCFVVSLLHTSTMNAVAFHRILLLQSLLQLIVLSWLQMFFHPTPLEQEFDPTFFTDMLVYTITASIISLCMVVTHPYQPSESMKWSIPANAIFCSGVYNIFLALASFQVLWQKGFYQHPTATPVITVALTLAALQTGTLAVVLIRIRYFLSVSQLRWVCLHRVVLNGLLPWLWSQDLSPAIPVDPRIVVTVRFVSTITYFIGYLWAGQAEGLSSMLSSEKEN